MRANRTAASRTGAIAPSSGNKEPAADTGPQLSEKEQAAKALDELHRLNSAIIAQWHNKKHKPTPPPIPLTDPPSPTFPSLTSPTSPSLHPSRHPLRFRTSFRNTILTCFQQRQWYETQSETDWDIHWAGKEWIRYILPRIHLQPWQRVNHFVTYYELTRKDLLIKNVKKMRNVLLKAASTAATAGNTSHAQQQLQLASEYNFWPETFNLPSEYLLFTDTFKRGGSGGAVVAGGGGGGGGGMSNSWIMKPIGSSQGKGIFLIDKLTQIADWNNALSSSNIAASSSSSSSPQQLLPIDGSDGSESTVERYIVQRYIHNPLLIGGKKFDIRLYVLVTSYHPLRVYMHRSGFARFSSTRYTTVKGELSNSLVHLTNVAIQKHGEDYDAASGGKWEIGSLRSYLRQLQDEWWEDTAATEDRVGQCFSLITTLVIRSLQSVKPLMSTDSHCFELYGYDVLLDANYKPWLIEVNASPSLSANTAADEQLKIDMLHDLFHTLEAERWNRDRHKRRTALHTTNTNHTTNNNNTKQPTTTTTAAAIAAAGSGSGEVGWGRVGGFDLLYDEVGGGLRVDGDGRALCCLGLWNDRVGELQAMWRRMAKLEARDREVEAKYVAEMKEKRDKQRERRKQVNG